MNGITFGDLHSWRDLSLILTSKQIGTPAPKVEQIDIPGGDGVLDVTEYFGDVKYQNRNLKFEVSTVVPKSQFMTLFSAVQNKLHGQLMKIILDEDPEWYYFGRISVSEWKAEKSIGKFTIECDCKPYKFKRNETIITATVADSAAVVLMNGRKRAVPEVKVETGSKIRIEYQGVNIWDLGSGSYTLPELELMQGANTVTLTGNGSVTFTYQEGDL